MILLFKCWLAVLFVITQPMIAIAQSKNIMRGGPTDPYTRSVSEFFYSRTGSEILQPVRIVGGVEFPGIYHIPKGTDLTTLLSIAGGAINTSDISEIRFTRTGEKSNNIDLYDHMEKGKEIILAAGDVVYIPRKEGWISPEAATTLTVIVSILSLGLTAYVVDKTTD